MPHVWLGSLNKLASHKLLKLKWKYSPAQAVLWYSLVSFFTFANKQEVSSYKQEETKGGEAVDSLKNNTSLNSSPMGEVLCTFRPVIFSSLPVLYIHDADTMLVSSVSCSGAQTVLSVVLWFYVK